MACPLKSATCPSKAAILRQPAVRADPSDWKFGADAHFGIHQIANPNHQLKLKGKLTQAPIDQAGDIRRASGFMLNLCWIFKTGDLIESHH